jgi:hypothetical protein
VSFRPTICDLYSTDSWGYRYVNKHNFPIMQDMFPGVVLEELDAGHWVHSEEYVLASYLPFLTSWRVTGLGNSSKLSIDTSSERRRRSNLLHIYHSTR